MWFLYFLSWVGLILQICVISLSVAAGLYYLAELVEEYTVFTAKVIKYLISTIFVVHVCLVLFEDLPIMMIICGFLGCLTYFFILQNFPYFVITSPAFMASVGTYAGARKPWVTEKFGKHIGFNIFTVYKPLHGVFTFCICVLFVWEVLGYFTICLWLVPFAFFVSLSANEYVLPTVTESRPLNPNMDKEDMDVVSNYFQRRGKRYGLLSFFKYAQDSILPQRIKKQF